MINDPNKIPMEFLQAYAQRLLEKGKACPNGSMSQMHILHQADAVVNLGGAWQAYCKEKGLLKQ